MPVLDDDLALSQFIKQSNGDDIEQLEIIMVVKRVEDA